MAGDSSKVRARLLALLSELSYKRATVKLASGRTSDFYIDTKQTSLHAEGSALLGEMLFSHVQTLRQGGMTITGVGGLTLGADPLATACALVSHQRGAPVHAFIIRKEPKQHGTESWVEGHNNLPANSPVLIVEDVVTTGGSTQKAIDRARASGLVPVAIVTVVDREEGGREALIPTGLPFLALFKRSDFAA